MCTDTYVISISSLCVHAQKLNVLIVRKRTLEYMKQTSMQRQRKIVATLIAVSVVIGVPLLALTPISSKAAPLQYIAVILVAGAAYGVLRTLIYLDQYFPSLSEEKITN